MILKSSLPTQKLNDTMSSYLPIFLQSSENREFESVSREVVAQLRGKFGINGGHQMSSQIQLFLSASRTLFFAFLREEATARNDEGGPETAYPLMLTAYCEAA
jgi:hypothetical protein